MLLIVCLLIWFICCLVLVQLYLSVLLFVAPSEQVCPSSLGVCDVCL